MSQVLSRLHYFLYNPMLVFWTCFTLVFTSLLIDGTFIKLWRLQRDRVTLMSRIAESKIHSKQLEYRIHEAYQTEFIERQARDQLDLVREGDLVFVFSDDATDI